MEIQKSFYKEIKEKVTAKVDYQTVIEIGLPFKDEDFPPNVASLISLSKTSHNEYKAKLLSEITWAKPRVVFGLVYDLFGEISPSRIKQGTLGDCYFLSAVSALAEFPDRIRSIFITQDNNEAGCYALQVYLSGFLRTMVVDDYIPCNPKTNKPAFTKSAGNELWVLLLEKAWAKANDNYENIESGDPEEALSFLTGAPSVVLFNQDEHEDLDTIWQKLLQADRNNYIICSSAGNVIGTSHSEYAKIGLSDNHAYSLLSVREITHFGAPLRLVQLRNPWGEQDWVGDWSDVSPLWTEELKAKVKFYNKDIGTFFMSFDDYVKYFECTVVCKYHDDYYSASFGTTQEIGDFTCYTFRVDSVTTGFITINQMEKRFMRENYEEYNYSPVSILLAKIEPNGELRCIGEGSKRYRAKHNIEITLAPGTYLLYVRIEWNQPYINQYCINTYTSNPIDLHKLEQISEFPLIPEILKSYCRDNKHNLKPMNAKFPQLQSWVHINIMQGFAYEYYYHLPLLNQFLFVNLQTQSTVTGLKQVYPTTKTPSNLVIPVSGDSIVVYRVVNDRTQINTKCEFKFINDENFIPENDEEFRVLLTSGVEFSLDNPPIISAIRGPRKIERLNSSIIPSFPKLPIIKPEEEKKIIPQAQKPNYESMEIQKLPIIPLIKKPEILPLKRQDSSGIKISNCPKNHGLKLDSVSKIPNETYICSNCNQTNFKDIGVWKCVECNYLICPICYISHPEPINIKEEQKSPKQNILYCNSKHVLKISTSAEGCKNANFICDKCRKYNKCAEGRLNCSICRFDICKRCQDILLFTHKANTSIVQNSQKFKEIMKIMIMRNHIKFLNIEDFMVLLCVSSKINSEIIIPKLDILLPTLCILVTKNGQNQFRKWLKHRLLNAKRLKEISKPVMLEFLKWRKATKNHIVNRSGQLGFDNWIFEHNDNSWTIEDEWIHLPDYRKEYLCFCGSSKSTKLSQVILYDKIKLILQDHNFNCYFSAGAYVARRYDMPCEFGFSLIILDSNQKVIDSKNIIGGSKLPARGNKGEKYQYKFIELKIQNLEIIRIGAAVKLEFWTKTEKEEIGWRGARVSDVFFRVLPLKYLC